MFLGPSDAGRALGTAYSKSAAVVCDLYMRLKSEMAARRMLLLFRLLSTSFFLGSVLLRACYAPFHLICPRFASDVLDSASGSLRSFRAALVET